MSLSGVDFLSIFILRRSEAIILMIYLSSGGNMNDIMTIRKEKLNPLRQGGIYEITKPMTQYIGNETTNNPYPVRNAIVSQQVIPRNIVEQQEQPKSIVS